MPRRTMVIDGLTPDWLAPGQPLHGIVGALSTTRAGGVSAAPYDSLNLGDHVGDAATSVFENRNRLRAGMSGEPELMWLTQVHGTRVVDDARWSAGIEADAAVTAVRGRAAVIMTADCLPVLLSSASGDVVAAAHAGWRGLAAGVLASTIDRMGVPPAELLAWVGPGISQAAFEVGSEVREAFLAVDTDDADGFAENERGRYQADLALLAERALRRAGLARISVARRCTFAESQHFFSHRRAAPCGRMATAIWRL